jgi:hypothetical protein
MKLLVGKIFTPGGPTSFAVVKVDAVLRWQLGSGLRGATGVD